MAPGSLKTGLKEKISAQQKNKGVSCAQNAKTRWCLKLPAANKFCLSRLTKDFVEIVQNYGFALRKWCKKLKDPRTARVSHNPANKFF